MLGRPRIPWVGAKLCNCAVRASCLDLSSSQTFSRRRLGWMIVDPYHRSLSRRPRFGPSRLVWQSRLPVLFCDPLTSPSGDGSFCTPPSSAPSSTHLESPTYHPRIVVIWRPTSHSTSVPLCCLRGRTWAVVDRSISYPVFTGGLGPRPSYRRSRACWSTCRSCLRGCASDAV